ncbi:uncharacterized protein [Gossypium hirsutum]|uniref:Uncharacterized protein n=1 Tax=Gossypium hirsutum TaxID=3635 RepID=A0A1U8HV98_GOSHI|nr:uncharacterized protein LOC107889916 [Gossypium hirsutum]
MRPKKKARSDGPVRVEPSVAPIGVTLCGHYGRRHPGKCWKTTGAYLRYRSTEHCVRDCLLRTDQVQALESIRQRCWSSEARQSALVYAARYLEDRDAPNIITGTFLIFDVPHLALIDIGSTHLYIASTASKTLSILVESTSSEVTIVSLLGQFIQVSKLFRDVPLEVQRTIFLVDLMELPFGKFDLILGMHWLVKHRVSLDCVTKRIVLKTEEDSEVVMIGEQRDYLTNVISVLAA